MLFLGLGILWLIIVVFIARGIVTDFEPNPLNVALHILIAAGVTIVFGAVTIGLLLGKIL